MEIIAHRGFCREVVENTPAAVLAAWQAGADAVEIDIRLSKDNRVVVIHDAYTKRVTAVYLRVSATDFKRLTEAGVASIKKILYAIPPDKRVFAEIKCKSEIIPALKTEIENSAKQQQIVIIGFDFQTMKQAKIMMPDICVCLSAKAKKDRAGKFLPYDSGLIELACRNKFSGLALEYNSITSDFVDACRCAGLRIFSWTVNDVETARFLDDCGIAGIITDRPDLIKKAIELVRLRRKGK